MTSSAGLTTAEARTRLATVGRNELPSRDRRTLVQHVTSVIREPMIGLLLAATALYVSFGDVAEAIALGVSVLAIVAITLVQERRSEHALDALRDLASPRARVMRDGAWRELDARELVPGDLVHIGEGDRAPADALLRRGSPLMVDESLLTGESVPVLRSPDESVDEIGRTGEPGPSVFAGTLVTSGNAIGEVMQTGARTAVGGIGAALGSIELARAPLQIEVSRVVRYVASIALVLCAALLVIHLAWGHGLREAALASVTLAMSLLPEELPLVLTIFLTFGAWRMARHRVLARRAAAIETLGAVTVLCVDKTGTLTANRMAIRRLFGRTAHDVPLDAAQLPEDVHEIVEFGLLACPRETTDAMDRAFSELAARALQRTEHVHPAWQWVREYSLTPRLLAVTHVWRADAQRTVIATKGAPEAIIDLCHLDADRAAEWRARADQMATEGLRVIGVAHASHTGDVTPTDPHDYPFEIVGLVGLADPLRPETAALIQTCHDAGVRVLMITGDHPTTARAIGGAAGLRTDDILTGKELETIDASALGDRLARVDVIARAAPAHKLRIIQALRSHGEVVGMTGDGVNDAPALKAADVGVAMGHGTDVAREASGIVVLDDALGEIVEAIRRGRTIYDNLRSVGRYLLAVHVPIAILALLPPLLGRPLLLDPMHIVLLELVIDPTCSFVFEAQPPAVDVMNRPPRGRAEHLFDRRGVGIALALGVAATIGPLSVVELAHRSGASDHSVRTLAFCALIAAGLSLVVATRGRLHRAKRTERNPAIAWMLLAVASVVAITISVPFLRDLFRFSTGDSVWLPAAVLAGALPVLTMGLASAYLRRSDAPRPALDEARRAHRGARSRRAHHRARAA